MGRKFKTRLDLVRPGLEERVINRQARQKVGHDRTARDRVYKRETPFIVKATRPLPFRCQMADRRIVRKDQDQIRHRELPTAEQKQEAKVGTLEQGTGSEKQDIKAPPPPDSDKQPQPETIHHSTR